MAEAITTPDLTKGPYVGPKPFEQQERNLFFGRDWESEQLIALTVAHPVILLYAQSGAGKSSLLNAKVLLDLETSEGCEILPVTRVRGDLPPGISPERITNLYIFNTLMSWNEITSLSPIEIIDLSLADFLRQIPRKGDEEGYPVLRVIVFDQLEELFTFYPERWPEREQFFEQINEALTADPYLRVLFVIHEEYLAQLDTYAELLPEQLRSRFRLERLDSGDALAAVDGPLQTTPRSFAPGVAYRLVDELLKIRVESPSGKITEQPGRYVEPVQLQVVCQSLWDALPPEVMEITDDSLEAFGDVDQALTRFYERAVTDTIQRTEGWPVVTEWRLRNWFEEELITSAGTRGLVYQGQRRTGSVQNEAVRILESHRIIRAEQRAGARWYELTHDRFISPIQRANRQWRTETLKHLARVAGSVITTLILILIAIGPIYNVFTQFSETERVQSANATVVSANATSTSVIATATSIIATATQSSLDTQEESQQAEAENEAIQATSTAIAGAVRIDRVRPVRAGISIGAEEATAGTLGYFAVDEAGQVYVISAASVLGNELNEFILQPGPFDGGLIPDDVIGQVFTGTSSTQSRGPIAGLTALGRLADNIDFNGAVPGVGPILGIRDPEVGLAINKLGRATGEKSGTIRAMNQTISVDFGTGEPVTLSGAALADIEGSAGDAGALVFDDEGFAVGIFIALGERGVVVPMRAILDLYNVSLIPPQVQIQDITALLSRDPEEQYDTRAESRITSIVVHHTATPADISIARIAEFTVENRDLPGITYHYCITPDGRVFQTQPLTVIPIEINRDRRDTNIDVCLIGDFSDSPPPPAQLNAATVLIAQLASVYNIPNTEIFGRNELQPSVASPGQTWPIWRETLLDRLNDLRTTGVPTPAVTRVPTPIPMATPDVSQFGDDN